MGSAKTFERAKAQEKERLSLRLAEDHKRLIEQAARISGQTVSDFVKSEVLRGARRLIQEEAVISLTAKGWDELVAFIENADDEPNEALRRAAERNVDAVG